MLNASKRRRNIEIKPSTHIILPKINPLLNFGMLTLIAKYCDDTTLCMLVDVCHYTRSIITLQPVFEARLWKTRFKKLYSKYIVFQKLQEKEEDEKINSNHLEPSAAFSGRIFDITGNDTIKLIKETPTVDDLKNKLTQISKNREEISKRIYEIGRASCRERVYVLV